MSERGLVGYDLIGDVHGCYDALVALLEKLGYAYRDGCYQHPDRQALFLGDLIDRGPKIRETLHLVRGMVEQGHALVILGNHELSAISYFEPAKAGSDSEFLLNRNTKQEKLLAATINQFESYPQEWLRFVDWFKTLPLFLDMGHFRAVHACWDQERIESYLETFGHNKLAVNQLEDLLDYSSLLSRAVDRLLRGPDMPFPNDLRVEGQDGVRRSYFRTGFWFENPRTYEDVVFQPDGLPAGIAQMLIPERHTHRLVHYAINEKPLFIGHYWRQGEPEVITPNIACLDYCAVTGGKLVAYRMGSEQTLKQENFVWVETDNQL